MKFIQETTSVRIVRDDDERCPFWLSIVLVLLFIGDVLSLLIFISISSIKIKQKQNTHNDIHMYVNNIHKKTTNKNNKNLCIKLK
jgi:hypothetical protein